MSHYNCHKAGLVVLVMSATVAFAPLSNAALDSEVEADHDQQTVVLDGRLPDGDDDGFAPPELLAEAVEGHARGVVFGEETLEGGVEAKGGDLADHERRHHQRDERDDSGELTNKDAPS